VVADVKLFDRVFGALALASILAFNMWFTWHVDGNSAQRAEESKTRIQTSLCEVFAAELALYRENPPENETRQKRFETYSGLWNDNCTGEEGS
jgi:hypothetical protein